MRINEQANQLNMKIESSHPLVMELLSEKMVFKLIKEKILTISKTSIFCLFPIEKKLTSRNTLILGNLILILDINLIHKYFLLAVVRLTVPIVQLRNIGEGNSVIELLLILLMKLNSWLKLME